MSETPKNICTSHNDDERRDLPCPVCTLRKLIKVELQLKQSEGKLQECNDAANELMKSRDDWRNLARNNERKLEESERKDKILCSFELKLKELLQDFEDSQKPGLIICSNLHDIGERRGKVIALHRVLHLRSAIESTISQEEKK